MQQQIFQASPVSIRLTFRFADECQAILWLKMVTAKLAAVTVSPK
jgi:hypothetical protein